MKQLTTLFMMVLALCLVSCDDDTETAINLDGEWEGDFGMYVEDAYGHQFDAEYTNIRFYWDGGHHGHGEQIDFYRFGPYQWQSYYFTWRVRDGVLYLNYTYDHQLDCAIYDYYMDSSHFTGRIPSSDGGYFTFRLFKLTNFNSWGRYDATYGYGYEYYDNYYAKSRVAQGADETPAIVRRGNRYVDGKVKE